jgi:hypothetical protein
MPADSILAARSALTETSAHPVSKAALIERLHDLTPTQKNQGARPRLMAAMSAQGHSRPNRPILPAI